jgi:hypothetical protein
MPGFDLQWNFDQYLENHEMKHFIHMQVCLTEENLLYQAIYLL